MGEVLPGLRLLLQLQKLQVDEAQSQRLQLKLLLLEQQVVEVQSQLPVDHKVLELQHQ